MTALLNAPHVPSSNVVPIPPLKPTASDRNVSSSRLQPAAWLTANTVVSEHEVPASLSALASSSPFNMSISIYVKLSVSATIPYSQKLAKWPTFGNVNIDNYFETNNKYSGKMTLCRLSGIATLSTYIAARYKYQRPGVGISGIMTNFAVSGCGMCLSMPIYYQHNDIRTAAEPMTLLNLRMKKTHTYTGTQGDGDRVCRNGMLRASVGATQKTV